MRGANLMSMLLQKLFAYGCLGLLIEVFFTGLESLLKKNWRLTSTTYLWMLPIYGLGGWALELIHALPWSLWLKAPLMVASIYGIEFVAGWLLERLVKKKVWDYGHGKYTIMGYIRLDFVGFWLGLAVFFDLWADTLHKIFSMIQTVL
jgi:uncharacterized membrane protein